MNNFKLKYREEKVFENVEIAKDIFKLSIKGKFNGMPGQFYMLRAWDGEPLLSRPISIHGIEEDKIVFLYQLKGKGTKILSKLKYYDEIKITGPLGNGFDIENISGKVAVVSGGIGIAPIAYLTEKLKNCEIDLYAGFKENVYVANQMDKYVDNIYISTEDGSEGHKGYITEIFDAKLYDVVLCCGPEIMMNKIIKMCRKEGTLVYVSMENKMACGVGACLVCTCKTKFGNKRTCKDGPVFCGDDIIID